MIIRDDRKVTRKRRHLRVRKKVFGTAIRPRLNVFRSGRHIYAQIVNDETGNTLAAASSLDPEIREAVGKNGGNIQGARVVGRLIADRARERGITKVVFDRGGYLYHGRVAALAEAAREAGLEF